MPKKQHKKKTQKGKREKKVKVKTPKVMKEEKTLPQAEEKKERALPPMFEKEKNESIENIKNLIYSEDSSDRKTGWYELSAYLYNNNHIKTFDDNDEVYIYKDGIYEPNGEKQIAQQVEEIVEVSTNRYQAQTKPLS